MALQVGGPLGGFLSPHQPDLPLLDSALGVPYLWRYLAFT